MLRAKGDRNWGVSLRNEGKLQDAAVAFRHALDEDPTFCDARDDLGEVLWIEKDLASALIDLGDLRGAEEKLRQTLAIRRKVLGNQNPMLAYTLNNLGYVLLEQGNWQAAEPTRACSCGIPPPVYRLPRQ